MSVWELDDGEVRLEEVVRQAERDGRQTVTRHGQTIAFVVPPETEARPTDAPAPKTWVDRFREGLTPVDIDIERNDSPCRDVEF